MKKTKYGLYLCALLIGLGCKEKKKEVAKTEVREDFPSEMVSFEPNPKAPVFMGVNAENAWDKNLRERGYILFEDDIYKMWYTGYNDSISPKRFLGLATSKDGINWERYTEKPLDSETWIEDMQVVKYKQEYYMFAEGKNDVAHLLTSPAGINWTSQGNLTILKANGEPISDGPFGTPTVWIEGNKKYLFYERDDLGIWLATSEDFKTWTNVKDEEVLKMGPEGYDSGAVAANQIVKYEGQYFMYYHGSSNPDWMKPGVVALWTSNVAMSTDLIHWTKYRENPIVEGDYSSPILVDNGEEFILYTMHDKVHRYVPGN
ncbi:glycosylase [Arenibacter sp. ARW7G5Y1]|uniref:glycosylase n=1 Tax=Arenibacter sp. ARW7G5Y1 TaxID=2135619 RepID=UPI000D7526A4|nr:glycosylase [Arenibacter sp. ARW7G5Y1]PXX31830.1 hypothetical protein C7972_101669 [Arenibacter sp. ARW7G5Y1]